MNNVKYSIRDLENITQIKAHTIRIWEQRYKLLTPKRTDTNIRFYNELDLKKILNINLLYSSGRKISKIATLTDSQIIEEAKSLIINQVYEQQSDIDKMMIYILNLDGENIKRILEEELNKRNLEEMYVHLLLPTLQKIGQLWQVNSISILQEHYFSNIIREFLISKIERIDVPDSSTKKAFLFLHDDEEHEFTLLIYYYLLKTRGVSCFYFGQKTPINDISEVYELIKPQIIISTFTSKISEVRFQKIEEKLLKFTKHSTVIISGGQLKNLVHKPSNKIIQSESISAFKNIISTL